MAGQLTMSGSLLYTDDAGSRTSLAVIDAALTLTGSGYSKQSVLVPVSPGIAVDFNGNVPAGAGIFVNRSATDFVALESADGTASYGVIPPGGVLLCGFDGGLTGARLVSRTAPNRVEYLVTSA